MIDKKSIPSRSPDIVEGRLIALKEELPEAFTEGRIDFDRLRAALGDLVDDSAERYSFTWAGKRDAIRLLQTPTRATLLPCPEESVDFDTTQNIFIEGENLEVLKLLYKSYFGRVKMIYIDPPYNTGNDFIYPDDYADPLGKYLELTGQQDAAGNLLTSNPETSGRYHSAWLNMMYPRLFLARQLLRDDGVIFVSIDDHEVHNLRMIMNEIFGEENFIATFVWQKRYSRDNRPTIGTVHDYILLYAKDALAFADVRNLLPPDENSKSVYRNPGNDPRGRWRPIPMTAQGYRPNQMYEITTPTGVVHTPPKGRCWSITEPKYKELLSQDRIWFGTDGNGQPNIIRYLSEVEGFVPWTWLPHEEVGHTDEAKKEIHEFFGKERAFDTPKPTRLMKRILQISAKPDQNEIVLDFFAGSGTLAQAVLELNREDDGNRRFIMVQLPEPTVDNSDFSNIAEICKQRIRQVINCMKEAKKEGSQLQLPLATRDEPEDLGFRVYKLAPSHFEPWVGVEEKEAEKYAQQMELFQDPLVEGWTVEGVLTEIALKHGLSLAFSVEDVDLPDAKVLRLVDLERGQSIYVSLDAHLDLDSLSGLDLSADDVFICRDAALDDETAANLALQCRLETI